jgi:hypothetical protein
MLPTFLRHLAHLATEHGSLIFYRSHFVRPRRRIYFGCSAPVQGITNSQGRISHSNLKSISPWTDELVVFEVNLG